ncbi:MAG: MalY/PatB family protein [Coriobacteriales bacterium]|jgi:cystathionine beta-lyase
MPKYDFDNVPSREGTYSFKFDFAKEMGHDPDELPMWVADMDFPTAPCVVDAIKEYSSKGFFGYSDNKEDYTDVVIDWFSRRYGVKYEPEWLVKTPGVVFAIYNAIRAFTSPGDSILIQTPVYYPFSMAINDNGRTIIENELVYTPGASPEYTIDIDDFIRKIESNDVKMFILCSPHNPVGRTWTEEELSQMGEICFDHGVIVVADEIHCDLMRYGHKFLPFLKSCPEMRESSIICTAPSKTFNLAGLCTSNIWIPNEKLRNQFRENLAKVAANSTNILGIIACKAAYEGGEDWVDEVNAYIDGNVDYMRDFLAENLPQLHMVEPEGTYLIWVDFSALGMETEKLNDFIQHKAKLWLDSGSMFGGEGGQFQRFNLACPRSTVEKAMKQLKAAVDEL